MTYREERLACDDMTGSANPPCSREVTMLDEKGYVYCADCGAERKATHRCRKLTRGELSRLQRGMPLERY